MAVAWHGCSPAMVLLICCVLAGRTLTSALPQERVAREADDLDADDSDEQPLSSGEVKEEEVEMEARDSDESDDEEGVLGFAERWINRIQNGLQRLGDMINWIREASKSVSAGGESEAGEKEARYFDPLQIPPRPVFPELPPPGFIRPGLHYPAPLPPFRFRPFRRPCCRHFPGGHRHFIGIFPRPPGFPPLKPVGGDGKDVVEPEVIPPKETPIEEKPGEWPEGDGKDAEGPGVLPPVEKPIEETSGAWPEGGGKDIEGPEIGIPKDTPVEEKPGDWADEPTGDLDGTPEKEGPIKKPEELPKLPEEGTWPEEDGPAGGDWPEEVADDKARGAKPNYPPPPVYSRRELNEDNQAFSPDFAIGVPDGEMQARALARDHGMKFLRRASNKRAVGT